MDQDTEYFNLVMLKLGQTVFTNLGRISTISSKKKDSLLIFDTTQGKFSCAYNNLEWSLCTSAIKTGKNKDRPTNIVNFASKYKSFLFLVGSFWKQFF